MSRYTLSNTKHKTYKHLFLVLDNNKKTKAFASKEVLFSNSCEILKGIFHGGDFYGGYFHGGIFHGGDFHGGIFHGGDFHGGIFHGGIFHGGDFRGGDFYGGDFYGGIFRGGYFHGGYFRDGIFRGGKFRDGIFRDGIFHGGIFRDGIFHGGIFRGGNFHGGDFYSGYLELQIQGTKHFLNIPDGKNIKIGCITKTPEQWEERIGKENGYTDEQISEYTLYVELATQLINKNKDSNK